MSSKPLDAALNYASRGWPVIPLHSPEPGGGCSCKQGKRCKYVGKHPRIKTGEDHSAASTDPDIIRGWWGQWPDANVGIVGGETAKLLVLDVDVGPGKEGDTSLAALEQEHGPLKTLRARSGSGGWHYYYRLPGAAPRGGKLDTIGLHGLDVICQGYQVVAPPSRHVTGGQYEWDTESGEIQPAPPWLIDLAFAARGGADEQQKSLRVSPRKPTPDILARARRYLAAIPHAIEGKGGDIQTFKAACGLVRGFLLPDDDAFKLLAEWNNGCQPPWSDSDLLTKLKRARIYGKREPGHLLSSAAPAAGQWDDPIPLNATYAPPLPLDVLPKWQHEWIEGEAASIRTAPDLPYILSISVISLTVTRKIVVEVLPTWTEPANAYTAAVLDVSEGKSPVFSHATKPVADHEEIQRKDLAGPIRDKQMEKTVAKKKLRKAIDDAAKETGTVEEVKQAAADEARIVVPPLPRWMADDASPEKLADMLMVHGERMGVFSAEGTPFEIVAGRYSDQANADVYLKAWSGDPITVDRIGREGGGCRFPLLTCGITIQPDVLRRLGEVRCLRGRGFLARWLYVVPKPLVGHRLARSIRVPGRITDEFYRRLRALLDLDTPNDPVILQLSGGAEDVFYEYRGELEPFLKEDGDLYGVRDWAAKTDKQLLRLAAILHTADRAGIAASLDELVADPISEDVMRRAVRLIRALTPHAVVAFRLMGADGACSDAEYLLGKLKTLGKATLTRRQMRLGARRFDRDAEMEPALRVLEEHGFVRLLDRRPNPKGSPASEKYELHPHVLNPPERRIKRVEREPDEETFDTFDTDSEEERAAIQAYEREEAERRASGE